MRNEIDGSMNGVRQWMVNEWLMYNDKDGNNEWIMYIYGYFRNYLAELNNFCSLE